MGRLSSKLRARYLHYPRIKSAVSVFNGLPSEIIGLIASHLRPVDNYRCERVSKK
ncbi:uncharacterized protein BDV14DRAFT_78380 [Aspergillus stella-maris]|uniref:uncharacterized protein n=1 Tax=Aspergillus stella-maris TaxID=1810926 RepID=UPI003CCD9C0D